MAKINFFIALFFSITTFTTQASEEVCQQQQCILVVDAGSTGSRIHLYSYDLDNNNSPININERWAKKIKPGLASIEANKNTIDAYLTTLFSGSPLQQNLPVYFYATAGMRLLPKPKQEQVYSLLADWFKQQSDWKLMSAKTITGSDEGLFGWIAINYQLGTLKEGKETVGVFDMGGASVQVVFPIQDSSGVRKEDLQDLSLYGHQYKLFAHSFLGLGQTEVAHQFLDSPTCFSNNYEMPTGQFAAGDAYACEGEVSSLINGVHKVNTTVQPALAASSVNKWYLMGGLVDLAKSEPFNFPEQSLTSQDLLDKANTQVCHQQWPTLNAQYPNNEYLYGYCLTPAYYYALIIDGYGIQPNQNLYYLGSNQNNDWTLGVVLYQQA